MKPPLGDLSAEDFLADYWQRKPCLFRNAHPGFDAGFDGDDLAGLACEEMAESRIVIGSVETGWELRIGPFVEREFAGLGERDWTLLVQDVEKHYPPLQELLTRFDFLPTWRMDDLMFSFAAPGGSVGPHVDQYDVFLLQLEGRRHWQIAEHSGAGLLPDCPLNILAEFSPEQEWTLEAGDMLYLPPGVAHHGVAVEPCLTCSVGFRAPSTADLLLSLGEVLSERDDQGGRYGDAGIEPARRTGEIDSQALQQFRQLMGQALEGRLDEFIGAFLSRFRLAHEPAGPPGPVALQSLQPGQELQRNPWTRMNWIERDGRAILFAAGAGHECAIELAMVICGSNPITVDPGQLDSVSGATVQALLNNGHLLLPEAG